MNFTRQVSSYSLSVSLLFCFCTSASAGARHGRWADPVIGANITFGSCTPNTVLNISATGTATYVFSPSDCDGNGFTAVCDATGTSAASMARIQTSVFSSTATDVLRFDRTGAVATVTDARFFSTSGHLFQLTHLSLYTISAANQTLTVTAYHAGIAISGSTITINYVMTTPNHVVDLTSATLGAKFNNIDEIRMTSSSGFGLSISNIQTAAAIPLPVNLLSFTGQRQGENVVLDWSTAQESNNHYFEIQRKSITGLWEGIGTVEGHGTVTAQENYTFTDPQPLSGTGFYRLRQVDLDGNSIYSFIVALEQEGPVRSGALTLFPNPVQGEVILTFNSDRQEEAVITVRNMAGANLLKTIRSIYRGTNSITLTGLGNLPQGAYAITLVTSSVSYQAKFLKR